MNLPTNVLCSRLFIIMLHFIIVILLLLSLSLLFSLPLQSPSPSLSLSLSPSPTPTPTFPFPLSLLSLSSSLSPMLLSTHCLDPCLWGESGHPASGPPASLSLHLSSSSTIPARSVHILGVTMWCVCGCS